MFFGNLYHLNAEQEPEHVDYPKDPAFKKKFGPRGVISSTADGKIEDTGPLTQKRMETVDMEVTAIRWPGVFKPNTLVNDLCAHEDMMPTLLAAAGNTTLKADLLKGKLCE